MKAFFVPHYYEDIFEILIHEKDHLQLVELIGTVKNSLINTGCYDRKHIFQIPLSKLIQATFKIGIVYIYIFHH